MSRTQPERVLFEFADHVLEGEIVDTSTTAAFNQPPERVVTIDADGSRYTVPERETTPA